MAHKSHSVVLFFEVGNLSFQLDNNQSYPTTRGPAFSEPQEQNDRAATPAGIGFRNRPREPLIGPDGPFPRREQLDCFLCIIAITAEPEARANIMADAEIAPNFGAELKVCAYASLTGEWITNATIL